MNNYITKKLDTSIFDDCTGKDFNSIRTQVPAEWRLVNSRDNIHIFKSTDNGYTVILSTDDDNYIRFCEVKRLYDDGKYHNIYLRTGYLSNVGCYRDIVNYTEIISRIEKREGKKLPDCTILDVKSAFRDVYRREAEKVDPLSVPLKNNKQWRTVSTDNGETCTDFIILPDNGQTDEDIEDFIHCSVYCPRYSYDFATGREITFSWHYKRTPYGIIIIHHRGIDW